MCMIEKKLKFIKEQEPKGLLSSLGIKRFLNKIPLVGPLLFLNFKMNETVNKFLLAVDMFMPEMHLSSKDLHIVLVDHLQKPTKEYKNLEKQEIHDIFIKKN